MTLGLWYAHFLTAIPIYKANASSASFLSSSNCNAQSEGELVRRPATGFLIFPVYLKEITSATSKLTFTSSRSTELRYSASDMNYSSFHGSSSGWANYFGIPTQELQWKKLDRIRIADKGNQKHKTFQFTYTNSSQERLKLLSVQEQGTGSLTKESYRFTYNSRRLPAYCSDKVDHWGYYNGHSGTISLTSASSSLSGYYAKRNPDSNGTYQRAEVLEKITYPTGGYTTFSFEPHYARAVVSANRTRLETWNKAVGGLRIKEIKSYPLNGPTTQIKYYYVTNYRRSVSLSSLSSSGILGGKVQYYWPSFRGRTEGGELFTFTTFSSNSLLPYGHNAQGSHIGYTEVVEDTPGNGYTRYTYTNFDTQEGSAYPYRDEPALN